MSVDIAILVGVAVGAAVVALLFSLFRRRERQEVLEFAEKTVGQLIPKLEAVEKKVEEGLERSRQTASDMTGQAYKRIENFSKEVTALEHNVLQVGQEIKKVSLFQDLFKTPKTTGKWGEAQLGHLLGEYLDRKLWEVQHYFKSGEAVDAVVKLPNDKLLPIDSKFNFLSYEKMVGASGADYEVFKRDFIRAVKEEIDAIAEKYIKPSEGTTDMALMFISAESVYYEIVNVLKDEDLNSYAWRRKVILTSPNTFYINLSAVLYWFGQANLQKGLHAILNRLGGIKKDATKLQDEFRKLGTHLGNADKVYHEVDHRFELLTERVQKVITVGEEPRELEGESKSSAGRLLE